MKRLKLVLVVAMIGILAISGLFPASVAAKGGTTVAVKNANGKAGESVDVNIEITGNPGLLGAVFIVTYDDDLTLTGAANGSAFSALTMTKPGVFRSPCRFVWDGQELSDEDIKDGTILTLTFAIPAGASEGDTYAIGIEPSADDIVDTDLETVDITAVGGTITVGGEGPHDPCEETIAAVGTMDEEQVSVVITNPGEAVNATVLLSRYGANGRFLGTDIKPAALANGKTTVRFVKASEDCTYKAFLVDSEHRPLCPEIAISAQEPDDGLFKLVVGDVSAKAGAKGVEVPIVVKNNPGMLGMIISVTYDNSLALVSAENGEAVSGVLTLTKPGSFASGCSFVWDGQELNDSDIKDGTVLLLKFDISESASAGKHAIMLSYDEGDIVDAELNDLSPELVSGGIVIQ